MSKFLPPFITLRNQGRADMRSPEAREKERIEKEEAFRKRQELLAKKEKGELVLGGGSASE